MSLSLLHLSLCGIETEFSVTMLLDGSTKWGPASGSVVSDLIDLIPGAGLAAADKWLQNGGRGYKDVGEHPEMCTPECDDCEVALYDLIVELILTDAIEAFEQANPGTSLRLYKNNVSESGSSFGCHTNFLIPRSLDPADIERLLTPYLITHQLFTGAGIVIETDSGWQFHLCQRGEHILNHTGVSTTRARTLLNSRDEPLANKKKYRRLHLIEADANILYAATNRKMRFLSLVLQMLAQPGFFDIGRAITPVEDFQALSQAGVQYNSALVHFGLDEIISPVDILWRYFEACVDFVEATSLPGYDGLLDEMAQILLALEATDLESLYGKVDWATKYLLLQQQTERLGALDYIHARQICLEYGLVYGKQSIAQIVRAKFNPPELTQLADTAKNQPPRNRAHLRAEFVDIAMACGVRHSVSWDKLTYTIGHRRRQITLSEPPNAFNKRFEAFLEYMLANINARSQ